MILMKTLTLKTLTVGLQIDTVVQSEKLCGKHLVAAATTVGLNLAEISGMLITRNQWHQVAALL